MKRRLISYDVIDKIGVIRLNNPPVNALSQQVRQELLEVLNKSAADQSEVVLLLCEGRTFIAGADIKEFGAPPKEPYLPDLISAIEESNKPFVVALHGNTLGGGLELALGAHYRIAEISANLGLPEVKLGIIPGAGGTQRLPRLVGAEQALDMITSGSPVSATKAFEVGLVDKLTDGDLERAAMSYCRELSSTNTVPRRTREQPVATPDDDFFETYGEKIARKTRGELAPGYIVDLVKKASLLPFSEGMKDERKRFLECKDSPQSAALRHVFFAERASSKLPGIPDDTPTLPVKSVAVIGAGTMGGGIAMCFANANIPATIVDTSEESLAVGLKRIRDNYGVSVKRARFSQEQVDRFLANITTTTDYNNISQVDMVVEAAFENMAVKKKIFSTLEKTCKQECILATNTSYLDINEIAQSIQSPGSVIGAHFFSPANVMKLLEIVRGEKTAPTTIKTLISTAKKIGKIPVTVGVCQGFVGNRMLKSYVRQAQLLLLEGASPEEIDNAMERWGMAMGPLAVGDLAGIDISYRSRRDQGIPSHSVKEHNLADTLVEMNRLGQKTGAGYYKYDSTSRQRLSDPELERLVESIVTKWGVKRRSITEDEIVDRLIFALINEGASIVREGIAARPSDVDIVYINGYGFPKWRGGPMFYADQYGLTKILTRLEQLYTSTSDEFWRPDPLLIDLAEKNNALSSLN